MCFAFRGVKRGLGPEVFSYLSEKLPFTKTALLQRELFLTMFILSTAHHCSLSSKLYITITLSNYKKCPVPLTSMGKITPALLTGIMFK